VTCWALHLSPPYIPRHHHQLQKQQQCRHCAADIGLHPLKIKISLTFHYYIEHVSDLSLWWLAKNMQSSRRLSPWHTTRHDGPSWRPPLWRPPSWRPSRRRPSMQRILIITWFKLMAAVNVFRKKIRAVIPLLCYHLWWNKGFQKVKTVSVARC